MHSTFFWFESNCSCQTATWNRVGTLILQLPLSLVNEPFLSEHFTWIPANVLVTFVSEIQTWNISFFSFGNDGKDHAPQFPKWNLILHEIQKYCWMPGPLWVLFSVADFTVSFFFLSFFFWIYYTLQFAPLINFWCLSFAYFIGGALNQSDMSICVWNLIGFRILFFPKEKI